MSVPDPIYSRVQAMVLASPSCTRILVGISEWDELCILCKKWGHDWPPGGDEYNPAFIEEMRAKFMERKIYRVDASEFLAVQ